MPGNLHLVGGTVTSRAISRTAKKEPGTRERPGSISEINDFGKAEGGGDGGLLAAHAIFAATYRPVVVSF